MRDYEKEIISKLLSESGYAAVDIPAREQDVSIIYTGVGYYLSFQNDTIPEERIVLDRPVISGYLGDTQVGFVAFMENSTFTLECYTYNGHIPENCRDNKFVEKV